MHATCLKEHIKDGVETAFEVVISDNRMHQRSAKD